MTGRHGRWRRRLRRLLHAGRHAALALLEIADAMLAPSPLPPRARAITTPASITVHPDRRRQERP